MASDEPEFEEKAADIIGLYLQPPANAAVFCVDEKSAIQALDRLDPVLPLSPGRAERHGFEYFRHGTLSLYAALNTRTGDVLGKTAPRHTSAEFIDFLSQIVASQPEGREIHIVVDNLSAHKTKYVFEFLQANPSLRIHYTPTSSSWLCRTVGMTGSQEVTNKTRTEAAQILVVSQSRIAKANIVLEHLP